jgi:hypothetical protein
MQFRWAGVDPKRRLPGGDLNGRVGVGRGPSGLGPAKAEADVRVMTRAGR